MFKKKVVFGLILVIVLLGITIGCAYARYTTYVNGNGGNLKVGKMICEMQVEASEIDESIVNPYCKVTLNNYNDKDEVTDVSVKYTVSVVSKDKSQLPDYYWRDSSGNIVAQNTSLIGSLDDSVRKSEEYTIVFKNTGEEALTQQVEFELSAVQIN